MVIDVPDPNVLLPLILATESSFEGETHSISEWIQRQRSEIDHHLELVKNTSEENDIEILLSFLQNILVRAMTGEAGTRTHKALKETIKSKSDLHPNVYTEALGKANYRWGVETGCCVITEVVGYFKGSLDWNWQAYLDEAKAHRRTNFHIDHLLRIKGIGFKVRDLALSMFDPYYAAFDLHVARVSTRIGLLNYGFELLGDPRIEMGNNPADDKNYLFLHKLFLRFSELTNDEYLPVDYDRIFWHFGRTYCKSKPKCPVCPIKKFCLTGKSMSSPIVTVQPFSSKTMTPQVNKKMNEYISLPFGSSGEFFDVNDLVNYIQQCGRNYIIIGGANVPLDKHPKPGSLDFWIRKTHTQRPGTRQAVSAVVDALVATGMFLRRNGLICPDSGRQCSGIELTTESIVDLKVK